MKVTKRGHDLGPYPLAPPFIDGIATVLLAMLAAVGRQSIRSSLLQMPAGHHLAQAWVEVFLAALKAKEPRLVIDPGGQEINFVVRHAELAGQHAGGVLHTVAETDGRDAEPIEVPAAHRHRVGVVDQECPGAELGHISGEAAIDRRRAQKTEDAPRPERVTNRLVE